MDVSASRLTGEHIADVSSNLKQLGFRNVLRLVGHRKFPNHFNILPIMHYLRQLFIAGLDEQIDLTFGLATYKISGGARVVNAALTQ